MGTLTGCRTGVVAELDRFGAPAAAADKALELFDADNDGALNSAELLKSPGLMAGIARLDSNADGKLTRDELLARFHALTEQSDLVAVDVRVSKGSQPLVGAAVTLSPEPFMGDGLQSYSGETEPRGFCRLRAERQQLPGLPTGYYRVHVEDSRSGLNETTGCEVADDASGSRLMIEL